MIDPTGEAITESISKGLEKAPNHHQFWHVHRGENTDLQQLLFHACFFFSTLRQIPLLLLIYVCPRRSQSANWHHGAKEISSLTHFCFPCLFPWQSTMPQPPLASPGWLRPLLAWLPSAGSGCAQLWGGRWLVVIRVGLGASFSTQRVFFQPCACFFIFIFDEPIIGNY